MDSYFDALNTFMRSYDMPGDNARTPFANMTLLSLLLLSLTRDRPFPKTKFFFRKEYDYIIVGGGTAGSVMASRLSQKPCVSVLLLEAGGSAPVLTEIPSAVRLFLQSKIDWNYRTTPQKYSAFSQVGNRVIWNSGKALGGGSVLNAMMSVRGNKRNYDDWEREGAKGWGYRDVLPYFKLLEDNRNIKELDKGYHGVKGPMTVEKPNYTPEIKEPILKATAALGFKLTDSNGRRQTGIYDLQGTLRNGRRCSTAKAYLVPAENRPNLDILKYAFARKILIQNKRAYGVEFDFNGVTQTVFARKEVIISSGSVRTPQILMLSGIGPKEHLEKFNIPVVADLPVGQNLQDHCASSLPFTVNSTITPIVFKNFSPLNILQYFTTRSGPLASTNQVILLGFLDGLGTTATSRDFPKHELYWVEFATIDARLNHNLRPEIHEQIYGPYEGKPMYTCLVHLLQPRSRGEILLQSLDPYEQPLINPNYYQDERDVQDVVEGLKVCLAVGTRPEMQKVQSQPIQTLFPGCEQYVGDIDKYFGCQVRNQVTTIWHPVGTARMGHPDDPRSVVDPQLRVIGVKGLRVINAAVMPIIPSGNTNVPTIMVAEKAYAMMKDDVLCQGEQRKRRRNRVIERNSLIPENVWNATEFKIW